MRLDLVLVERGLAPSRSRARALIMAGDVRVDGHTVTKPGTPVAEGDSLEVIAPPRYVSRGGDKLAAALEASGIDPAGLLCLDIGASTGGFTDALLQAGAGCVAAVDVGYGQLDWRLRQDDRVITRERVNARYLTADDLPTDMPGAPQLLVVDVAFIGVGKILPAASGVCAPQCDALILVKPQFECGPERVGPGGVVTDATARRDCLAAVGGEAQDLGWSVVRAIPSPIRGAAGNWECFLQLRRPPSAAEFASLTMTLDGVDVPDA